MKGPYYVKISSTPVKAAEHLRDEFPRPDEGGKVERAPDLYETLAARVIQEAAKLPRRLDIYDLPLLTRLIKDAADQFNQNDRPERTPSITSDEMENPAH